MTSFFLVFLVFILLLLPSGAVPQSALDLRGNRTQRDVSCRAGLEYLHGNICCLNCPAGTHVKSRCTSAGQQGECEECDYGTYTEHSNGLNQCFMCTRCRSDQEIVRPCIHTQDTECQCKSGRFCAPDQACEVCKKCSRCEKDEVIVRYCTSTTNTECKKIQPKSVFASGNTAVIVPLVFAGVITVMMIILFLRKKRCRAPDSQRNLPDGVKAGQYTTVICPTEERKSGDTRRPSHSNWQLEDEQFPKLVPLNGEESLRKCFEYFEEIEVDYHKRFFRQLGITDNVIKSKEHLLYEDKIHDLLNIWMEKEGREASLNDLLKALLNLNQRRTAETVKEKAIHNHHYICEC
ncbi:tumor necrosis factor receptor superfamily member 22-like isoform X3 [Lates japonicus]|uniref:Tumor necrosis factor receptor superfamily member 22-like isoform X3 n=1 Tax=Lates japonicus TaxID=270547 RepID=A0AAD3R2D2_LATJO|nr:tumor necrosis factor receptor superfamily member 22-like isoform X3 [Lates japonicus]